MRRRSWNLLVGAWVALALLAGACNDSDPVAPAGSSIDLSASPSDLRDVDLNPITGEGMSTITALVLDANSLPLDGVAVFFSTNEGTLASGGVSVATNGDGIAQDVLTTGRSAQVTGRSGSAMDQVTVTVGNAPLVETVLLTATSATMVALNGKVDFTVNVTSTLGLPVEGAVISFRIVPSGGGVPAIPNGTQTNANGILNFSVEGIVQDITVTVSTGGVSSDPTSITLL